MGARLLVIGLDGATLDLVAPWAAAGELPTLARLMAAGSWGPLRSTLPPATFPAWTSLVTGVNPGRHGVLDFVERVPGTFRGLVTYHDSCAGLREMGVKAQPRALLAKMDGIRLSEMAECEMCCGVRRHVRDPVR